MAKSNTDFEVNVGDTIEIHAQGISVSGEVAVVHWWSEGWDIEIDKANVQGGYSRWKQWQDGGRIHKLNGKEVIDLSKTERV